MDRETFDRKYAIHLNSQQAKAVHAVDGAVLLLAVPGSGKTTVLVTRLGYMLCCCGISADKILTMTYTKAATGEMKQRFAKLFGEDCPQVPEFRTINGVSSKIIDFYTRTHGSGKAFTLISDDSKLSQLVSDLYRKLSGEFATQNVTKELRKFITYAKNMMLSKEEIGKLDTDFKKFPELYNSYNSILRQKSYMDYDDQMVYANQILERYPDILAHFQDSFPYICVDESQDTSKIQHSIIHLLAQKSGNIFMVGDEDQSIYGFRAAYPDALIQFEHTYPNARVLLMEENYRSTPEILSVADAFVQKNSNRHPKKIHPTRASGANVHLISVSNRAFQYSWLINAAAQGEGQTAILYRNNDSALPLIDLLDRSGITYRCRQMDDTFFTHRIIADIMDIIAFARDEHNSELFMRIYYKIGGGISKKAAEYACEQSKFTKKPILFELLRFSQLSNYARDNVIDLIDLLPIVLQSSAINSIKYIWNGLHYRDYAEKQKLDTNKFDILCLLAEQEPELNSFLDRLDYLRKLVSEPLSTPNANFVLSTVHSSKGLEYDTVYILDVFDGILPSETNPKSEEEQKQYQEERRLFYVAMTRAKNNLFLFYCSNQKSAFMDELRLSVPIVLPEENDIFESLKTERCEKSYNHAQNGMGTIKAFCEDLCLIVYQSGKEQFLTVGQMYEQRAVLLKMPNKHSIQTKKRKTSSDIGKYDSKQDIQCTPLMAEEKAAIISGARPGRKVVHSKFGEGNIIEFEDPFVTVRFPTRGKKKFLLLDTMQRGLLCYDKN